LSGVYNTVRIVAPVARKILAGRSLAGHGAALGAMLVDATGPGGAQALPGSSRRSAFPID